jgi:predicted nucleotidyltransferase
MDIIQIIRKEIKKEIKTARLPIKLIYIYGSYAKGKEKEGSDIDIAVLFDEIEYSKNPLTALEIIHDTAVKIERLIKKDVDIHILNRASLIYSYVVVTTGIPAYMSSKTELYRYQNKVLGMFFDFKPFFEKYISTYVGI